MRIVKKTKLEGKRGNIKPRYTKGKIKNKKALLKKHDEVRPKGDHVKNKNKNYKKRIQELMA